VTGLFSFRYVIKEMTSVWQVLNNYMRSDYVHQKKTRLAAVRNEAGFFAIHGAEGWNRTIDIRGLCCWRPLNLNQ
jgi:hypothetical protein